MMLQLHLLLLLLMLLLLMLRLALLLRLLTNFPQNQRLSPTSRIGHELRSSGFDENSLA